MAFSHAAWHAMAWQACINGKIILNLVEQIEASQSRT